MWCSPGAVDRRGFGGEVLRSRFKRVTLAVLLRFGLVSTAVVLLYADFMKRLPVTLDAGSWYVAFSVLTLLLVGLLATYGFLVALAGRRPFGD